LSDIGWQESLCNSAIELMALVDTLILTNEYYEGICFAVLISLLLVHAYECNGHHWSVDSHVSMGKGKESDLIQQVSQQSADS